MLCPFCGHREDRVLDSRESREGLVIRRRRECQDCGRRFTTYERSEDVPFMVVKKDGRRDTFERSKLLGGLARAAEKRPVSMRQLEGVVERVERELLESPDRELKSERIGQIVMDELKTLDKVAYIRFASVYLEFRDVREFIQEIEQLFKG